MQPGCSGSETAQGALGWGSDLLALNLDFLSEPFPLGCVSFPICKMAQMVSDAPSSPSILQYPFFVLTAIWNFWKVSCVQACRH